MEVDRIRKVADMIEAHPEHFDMTWFLQSHGRLVTGVTRRPLLVAEVDLLSCGTTACIGGWAAGLWPAEIESDDDIEMAGRRILGLSEYEARRLFYDSSHYADSAADAASRLRGMADDYEAASA